MTGPRPLAASLIVMGAAMGCSSERDGNALDLGYADGRAVICLPVPAEGSAYFGEDTVTVVGDDPATITGIELIDAEGVILSGAMLMDPEDGVVGYGHEADIATYEDMPESWADRVPAVGETLQPRVERNLILLLEPTGEPLGSALAARITYEADDRVYQQQTHISMLLSSGDCTDEVDAYTEANW